LYECRYDPARLVVEVYDNTHPTLAIQQMSRVEPLASRSGVVLAEVGQADRRKHRIDVIQQPGAVPFGEMPVRSLVETDVSSIRINGVAALKVHAPTIRAGGDGYGLSFVD
jgi:hypothetical protein